VDFGHYPCGCIWSKVNGNYTHYVNPDCPFDGGKSSHKGYTYAPWEALREPLPRPTASAKMLVKETCPECGGAGRLLLLSPCDPCPTCKGSGKIIRAMSLQALIAESLRDMIQESMGT